MDIFEFFQQNGTKHGGIKKNKRFIKTCFIKKNYKLGYFAVTPYIVVSLVSLKFARCIF